MSYLILICPLIFSIALSAKYMRAITVLMQARHYQYLKSPNGKKVLRAPSVLWGGISYYDELNNCICGISELPFDISTLEKVNDLEINLLSSKRRKISRFMPFILVYTALSIPSLFIYQLFNHS